MERAVSPGNCNEGAGHGNCGERAHGSDIGCEDADCWRPHKKEEHKRGTGNIAAFPNKGAYILKKLLDSAIGNARQKKYVDVDTLYVKNVRVDEGPTMKRFLPRAMGRATPIRKRTSHIALILDET